MRPFGPPKPINARLLGVNAILEPLAAKPASPSNAGIKFSVGGAIHILPEIPETNIKCIPLIGSL